MSPKEAARLLQAFSYQELVAPKKVSEMFHETAVIPVSNWKLQKLCKANRGPKNDKNTLADWSIQFNSIQFNPIQSNPIQYNSIQINPIQINWNQIK